MFGIVIDSNGFKIEFISLDKNNEPEKYDLRDGEKIVTTDWNIANTMLKPKWESTTLSWIETATEEEIKEWQEKNNSTLKEPSETEILQKQLLETQAIVANLQEQILLNGGIK